jgi:ABC-2 type transport system ATP-binding protein
MGDIHVFKPVLNANFELLEQSVSGETCTSKIRMLHHAQGNELLAMLINKVHILSFNELIPSMNDIFIRAVKGNSTEK